MRNDGKKVETHDLEVDGDRFAHVVELGCPIEEAKCSILLYAHVDTVYGTDAKKDYNVGVLLKGRPNIKWTDPWPDRYEMKVDGDNVRGSGAYDMKPGVMIAADLARYYDPPPGVHITIAFLPDEENLSAGQQAVAEWILAERRKYHVCLSAEVEPLPAGAETRQHICIARKGSVKLAGDILIAGAAQGHMAAGAPNVINYLQLLRDFPDAAQADMRKHNLLGHEGFDGSLVSADGRNIASPPMYAAFGYKALTVPEESPDREKPYDERKLITREVARQRKMIQALVRDKGWDKRGVDVRLWEDKGLESYLPFCTDPNHPVLQVVKETAKDIAHPDTDPVFVGGGSNSDANLFYSLFHEHWEKLGLSEPTVVFDVPYWGYGAHSMNECASLSSIAIVREIIWKLLTDTLPAHYAKKEVSRAK